MKTKHLAALLLAMALASTLSAQANKKAGQGSPTGNNGNTARETRTPDGDWSALVQLTAKSPGRSADQKKTREEHASARAQQVAQARAAAQAAKEFQTRYPNDSRVGQARKIEAISGLRSVTADDPVHEQAAVATAKAFRLDPAVPMQDRFQVAVAMDSQSLGLKLRSQSDTKRGAEQKKLVEGWRAEFGDMPEVEDYAMALARRADPKYSTEMATQVLRSPAASAANRKEATFIKERSRLLGQRVQLKLPLLKGGELDLEQQQGHVTVVVVWSPAKPAALQPLMEFQRSLPRGAQVVCLALGGSRGEVGRVQGSLPVVNHFAHAPLGAAAHQAALALKLQLAPYVYVLNKAGVLTDFGPLNELPALLIRAGVVQSQTS